MTTRVQPQRFTTTQTAPASGARLAGELWTNAPDLQIGFIDASRNPQKLVAVRYFSAQANYAQGDFVINNGVLLAAKSAITAAAFNSSQWTQIGAFTDGGGPYLPVSGGTVTGPLILNADPSANLGAATKQYVDNKAATIGAGYLPLTGGAMSGPITLPGAPTAPNQAANKAYVDSGGGLWLPIAGGTMTGPLTLAIDPANPLDAVTKEYADKFVPIAGGMMTGRLTLAVDPTYPLDAVTKEYADHQFLPIAGGTMIGTLTLATDPVNNLDAATKNYVDTKLIAQGDNRLINGDMRVIQRGVGPFTASNYTVDRWVYGASQAGKGSVGQVTLPSAAFAGTGFGYCVCFTASAVGYASSASDAFYLQQPVEAEMIGDLVWGNPNAQPAVLSFWVSSTLTGQFGGAIRSYPLPAAQSFPFTFNIPTAQLWTKIVVPIPPAITGAWVMQGNAGALAVAFDLGSGTNFQASSPNAWVSANFLTPVGCVSMVGAGSSNRLNFTGVKLEIGATATAYPHQSPARNILDCQRYFCIGQAAATGYGPPGATVLAMINFPGTMRIAPTVALTPVGSNNTGAGTVGPVNDQTTYVTHPITATGFGSFTDSWQASAEL